jgi:DNA-binding MarR family transcriptional regulator
VTVLVSRETVADLFRQIQAVGRSMKAVAGRQPYGGLRLSTVIMLGYIDTLGEVRSSALADQLGLDASVISRQLGILEGLGLTARRPDPADGRAWLSHVTPTGREVLAQVRSRRLQAVQRALAGWSESDAQHLVAQLSRLEADLAQAAHEPSEHTVAVDGLDASETDEGPNCSSTDTRRKVMS